MLWVIRANGFFWLSSRPDFVGEVSQAGAFVRHQGIGRWWAAVPKDRWPDDNEFDNMMKQHWTKDYGDRRQEIVFIGLKDQMKKRDIIEKLDKCLVAKYLSAPELYKKQSDPFPIWFDGTN